MKSQMQMIEMTETTTGRQHFDVPKGEGHGKQKKDLYTSFMLAARCIYDELWLEQLPESILHHGGVMRSRDEDTPTTFVGNPDLGASTIPIPEGIRDKLELGADPEGYKQKILQNRNRKRTVLTSASAVLKPVPKKK
jgi:hypothetical protein